MRVLRKTKGEMQHWPDLIILQARRQKTARRCLEDAIASAEFKVWEKMMVRVQA